MTQCNNCGKEHDISDLIIAKPDLKFESPKSLNWTSIDEVGKTAPATEPKIGGAYLVHTHRYGFRPGEPARIIGVKMVQYGKYSSRPCYHVRYDDGKEDYVVIGESTHEVISFQQIVDGEIPKVNQ